MTTTTNNLVNVNNSVMNTIFADSKSAARQRINSENIRKDFSSLDVWSALHNVNSRVKSYKVNGETYGAQSLRLVALLAQIGKKKFTARDIILFDFSDVFNAPQTTAETREELLAKTTERGTLCTIKRDKDTNLYYIVTLGNEEGVSEMDIITSILCRYKDTIKAFNAPLNKTIKDNNGAAVQSGERGAFFGSEVQWEKALTLADKALAKAAEKQLAAEKRAKDKAERAKIREQKQAEREEKRKARLLQQAADMERKAAEKREEVARLNAPQTIDKDAQKDVKAA